ncbi:hypothetical protein MRX96_045718 [Rhipicephalus microplus]
MKLELNAHVRLESRTCLPFAPVMVVGGGDELAELAAEEAEMGEHVARLESPAGPVERAARRLTAGIRHGSLAPPRLATKGTTAPPRNGRRAFCAAAPEMGALIRRRLFFPRFPNRRRGGL